MPKTTLLSFNSWSGSVPGFHSFLSAATKRADYLALQEVHHAVSPDVPTLIMPNDQGSRLHPFRAHLCQELDQRLASRFDTIFEAHIDGIHDFEFDSRVQYGQYSAVRNETMEISYSGSKFIYGQHNQFNTEQTGGSPCGKVAIGHVLRQHSSTDYLIVVNVHGFWSMTGKLDSSERYEQNLGINALIMRLKNLTKQGRAHVVVLGDLNYTSETRALHHLARQPGFGPGGGIILNHRFNIKETRTVWYKKPVREADFVIVSRSLRPYIENFEVHLDDVPSDHGLLELTLKL